MPEYCELCVSVADSRVMRNTIQSLEMAGVDVADVPGDTGKLTFRIEETRLDKGGSILKASYSLINYINYINSILAGVRGIE